MLASSRVRAMRPVFSRLYLGLFGLLWTLLGAGCGGSGGDVGDGGASPDAGPPPPPKLVSRAVLPATTFASGPASGAALGTDSINGLSVPFDSQPVQGVSALVRDPDGDGNTYLALVDNGYGTRENSADFNLRVYRIRPDFAAQGVQGGVVQVVGIVELQDPDRHVDFEIANEQTAERVLTGADFDPESLQVAPDGSWWIGDDIGPYLLHVGPTGVVLEPPIELPDNLDPELDPDQAGGGFRGLAISPDGATLFPILDRALPGSPAEERVIFEFDIATGEYRNARYRYLLDDPSYRLGAFVLFADSDGLVIEHDGVDGSLSGYKRIHQVTIGGSGGVVEKVSLVDLTAISDVDGVAVGRDGDVGIGGGGFGLPFAGLESLIVLGDDQIGVMNDNNFPFGLGRHAGTGNVDDTEFVVVELSEPLMGR